MLLKAHGLRIELPRGWSGRVFAREDDVATLHAASYQLALDDGEFGDASTAAMPSPSSFIALTEYRPGNGLTPGSGLFAPRAIPRRLDPASFSERRLAHPRPRQVGAQHFFTAADRPFCLYLVVCGPRIERRAQLAVVDRVLATLRISSRVRLAEHL